MKVTTTKLPGQTLAGMIRAAWRIFLAAILSAEDFRTCSREKLRVQADRVELGLLEMGETSSRHVLVTNTSA
jgi:hypothetical protein